MPRAGTSLVSMHLLGTKLPTSLLSGTVRPPGASKRWIPYLCFSNLFMCLKASLGPASVLTPEYSYSVGPRC